MPIKINVRCNGEKNQMEFTQPGFDEKVLMQVPVNAMNHGLTPSEAMKSFIMLMSHQPSLIHRSPIIIPGDNPNHIEFVAMDSRSAEWLGV